MNEGRSSEPGERLLTADDVAHLLAISKSSVWRLRDRGLIPKPARIGSLVRWRGADIDEWIERGCPELEEYRESK